MPTLLLFAAIREAAGTARTPVDAATVGEALKIASERFGARFEQVLACCSVLHDEQTVPPDQWWARAVGPDDEIALLLPATTRSRCAPRCAAWTAPASRWRRSPRARSPRSRSTTSASPRTHGCGST